MSDSASMHDVEPYIAEPAAQTADASVPRDALIEHYRLLTVQHLRDRGTMNALLVGLLDGTRPYSDEEFAALCHTHDLLTREAGAAMTSLNAVVGSEGVC